VDVYVAGFVADIANPDQVHAVYWKNGRLVKLPNENFVETFAASVTVCDTDVYVAGYGIADLSTPASTTGLLWKNGTLINLGLGNRSRLTSLTTSNHNIYAVVTPGPWPTNGAMGEYLVNDKLFSLVEGFASSVAVSGDDVYVSGNWGAFPKYWKNGKPINLTEGWTFDFTTSITVAGSDVYIAGTHDYRTDFSGEPIEGIACYWKNGNLETLTNGYSYAGATSIYVSGHDVYVAGYDIDDNVKPTHAVYWKNHNQISLTDGLQSAVSTSIAAVGNEVFITGIRNIKNTNYGSAGIACYWKNGKLIDLTDSSRRAGANSVYLWVH
jgi:hypothetical protein